MYWISIVLYIILLLIYNYKSMKRGIFLIVLFILTSCSWENIEEQSIKNAVWENQEAIKQIDTEIVDVNKTNTGGNTPSNTISQINTSTGGKIEEKTIVIPEKEKVIPEKEKEIKTENKTKETAKSIETQKETAVIAQSQNIYTKIEPETNFYEWKNYETKTVNYSKVWYVIWDRTFNSEKKYSHILTEKKCIDKYCYAKWSPATISWSIVEFRSFQKDGNYPIHIVKYDKNTQEFSYKTENEGPGATDFHEKITQNWILVETKWSIWCGGSNYTQSVNKNFADIPKEFSIWNVKFSLQKQNFKSRYYMLNTEWIARAWQNWNKFSGYSQGKYINTKNFVEELEKIIAKKKTFPVQYYLNFDEFPWVQFHYKADIKFPTGVFLTDENIQEWLVNGINLAENIMNNIGVYKALSHEDSGVINIQTDGKTVSYKDGWSLKGIFELKKYDEGKYLVYMKDKYSLESMAELCKPLVYIYGKDNTNMSLNIETPKYSEFTKLIPEFQEKNTWNFRANNNSVHFWNDSYDYLYYAVKVPNYSHNQYGWIIEGSEARKFFTEKLDFIWFNEQESNDFIEYWTPRYEAGKHYFVSFKFNEELDPYAKLNFSHEPDSLFRVLLDSYEIYNKNNFDQKYFYENAKKSFDNELLKTYNRSGKYDVFEWGWVLKTFEHTYIK